MEKKTKRNRSIGKAALFLAFLGPLGVIGIAFAILDIISDKKKEYKHGLDIAAIIISCLFIGYLIYAFVNDLRFPDEIPTPTAVETMELPEPVEEGYLPADLPIQLEEQEKEPEAEADASLEEVEEEFEIIIIDEEKEREENGNTEEESTDEAIDSDSVSISIPKEFVGEITQEELNEAVSDKNYQVAELNEDGSVTYVLSKDQHKELLATISKEINGRLKEMAGSDTYPNITSVEPNDDYTSFTVKTKNHSLDSAESASVIEIYNYGGMYAVFSGKKVDNIHVDYVNDATGEVISSANSKDVGKDI